MSGILLLWLRQSQLAVAHVGKYYTGNSRKDPLTRGEGQVDLVLFVSSLSFSSTIFSSFQNERGKA
jgi:hypothetical protein